MLNVPAAFFSHLVCKKAWFRDLLLFIKGLKADHKHSEACTNRNKMLFISLNCSDTSFFFFHPWDYRLLEGTSILKSYIYDLLNCVNILKTIYSQLVAHFQMLQMCHVNNLVIRQCHCLFIWCISMFYVFVLCYSVILVHDKADAIYMLCYYLVYVNIAV